MRRFLVFSVLLGFASLLSLRIRRLAAATEGVRDALEMRRGIREEQYNNRYTNVPPLVPRSLRLPVRGRLDHAGAEEVGDDLIHVLGVDRTLARLHLASHQLLGKLTAAGGSAGTAIGAG